MIFTPPVINVFHEDIVKVLYLNVDMYVRSSSSNPSKVYKMVKSVIHNYSNSSIRCLLSTSFVGSMHHCDVMWSNTSRYL